MARKRMIDPGIWQSQDFGRLSQLAKLVFIGLFSNADDEGRGRANPTYIKSILFPYEDKLRVNMVQRALDEIKRLMSITFYEESGGEFYQLDHWKLWQKVDKPTPSKLPAAPGSGRGGLGEESCAIEKEQNTTQINASEFMPPSLQQVRDYCQQRQNGIEAQRFLEYYASKDWMVGTSPMKDWRAAVRSWEGRQRTSGFGSDPFAGLMKEDDVHE